MWNTLKELARSTLSLITDHEFAGALRRQLQLDRPADSPTVRDRIAFAVWALVAVIALLAPWLTAFAVATLLARAH